MDGEQAWTEKKRSRAFGPEFKKMVTSVNGELSGRRISVDGEQAWTENKRGRRTSVDREQAWFCKKMVMSGLHDRLSC